MQMLHETSLSAVDLNLLVVLRALLTERHVTRAAERIGLSQSATSHALSRLRELYGDPLLVRRGRALVLTPRAERLLPTLERGLSDLKAAIDGEPEFEPGTARRRFTLGMADYLQAVVLGPLLRAVQSAAPHVDLNVVSAPDLEEQIAAGNMDLGLQVSGRHAGTLQNQSLFDDDFVCLVRRGHPRIAKRLTIQSYLAARHVVVAPSGTSGSLVDTELAARGLERRVALRVSNFLVAPIVVAETDFLSTMPQRLGVKLAERYGLRALPPPIELPRFGFAMLWHQRLELEPAQRWLRELVTEVSGELFGSKLPPKKRRSVSAR
ncbi:MAG: LysR family transcriptional regulator [Myxococcales bacterium]|nr:MAG: LysR family transcriptional regulator [Myxococcales bacterium]